MTSRTSSVEKGRKENFEVCSWGWVGTGLTGGPESSPGLTGGPGPGFSLSNKCPALPKCLLKVEQISSGSLTKDLSTEISLGKEPEDLFLCEFTTFQNFVGSEDELVIWSR